MCVRVSELAKEPVVENNHSTLGDVTEDTRSDVQASTAASPVIRPAFAPDHQRE